MDWSLWKCGGERVLIKLSMYIHLYVMVFSSTRLLHHKCVKLYLSTM